LTLAGLSLLASFLRYRAFIYIRIKASKRTINQSGDPKTAVIGLKVAVFSRPEYVEEADHDVRQGFGRITSIIIPRVFDTSAGSHLK